MGNAKENQGGGQVKEERCSFCDEPASSEKIMIQAHGKEVRICEECVDLCNDILASRRKDSQ